MQETPEKGLRINALMSHPGTTETRKEKEMNTRFHNRLPLHEVITRAILMIAVVVGLIVAGFSLYGQSKNKTGDYMPGYYGDGQPSLSDINICQVVRSSRLSPMELIYYPTTNRWQCEIGSNG